MTQYVKFKIPKLIPTLNTREISERAMEKMKTVTAHWVTTQLYDWASKHTNVEYVLHDRNHGLYVEFDEPAHITLFMLTWEPKPGINATSWKRISIVDTLDDVSDEQTQAPTEYPQ